MNEENTQDPTDTMKDEGIPEEEFVSFGKSWDDLEKEHEGGEDELGQPGTAKGFTLSKREIAELAYDSSFFFRTLVEGFERAGEEVGYFIDLTEAEQDEWTEVAGLALNMQGDPDDSNFARLVHAKTSMGLLKDRVAFSESFIREDVDVYEETAGKLIASPLVAPWECLPHERRIPLLMFKATVRQLFRLWDRDNELLKR